MSSASLMARPECARDYARATPAVNVRSGPAPGGVMPRTRAARRLALVLAALCATTTGARSAAPPATGTDARAAAIPDDLLRGLRWRSIGPYRGGRVVAVA